jgi:hypothetical protein
VLEHDAPFDRLAVHEALREGGGGRRVALEEQSRARVDVEGFDAGPEAAEGEAPLVAR